MSQVDAEKPEEALRSIGHPTTPLERLMVGHAYFLLGDYAKAVENLDAGLVGSAECSFYTTAAAEQLVTALCIGGESRRAGEAVRRFAPLVDPDHLRRLEQLQRGQWPQGLTDDWMEFAVVWLQMGAASRPDLAERLCRGLSRLSPEDPRVWFNLGRACADQQKWQPAIDAFGEHLARSPDSLDGLVSRAWCYKLSGQRRECEADAARIRRLAPYDPDLPRLLEP